MIVYGAGGMGREVMREFGSYGWSVADDKSAPPETWTPQFHDYGCVHFIVAVGDGRLREKMIARAEACGDLRKHALANPLVSPRAYFASEAPGRGTIVMPGAKITCDVKIGKSVLVNTGAIGPHDCVLEDFSSLQPGCILTGRVHVKKYAYVGAGAVLVCRSNSVPLVIGEGATVGAGAVVLEDVPDGACVVGNPARRLP